METRSLGFIMFPSINLLFLSKISIVVIFFKVSFSMVVFYFSHVGLHSLDVVVVVVFVFNNYFLKKTS
jgi:hypothetical protein